MISQRNADCAGTRKRQSLRSSADCHVGMRGRMRRTARGLDQREAGSAGGRGRWRAGARGDAGGRGGRGGGGTWTTTTVSEDIDRRVSSALVHPLSRPLKTSISKGSHFGLGSVRPNTLFQLNGKSISSKANRTEVNDAEKV